MLIQANATSATSNPRSMPRETGSASTDGNGHYHKVIIASGSMETGTVVLTYACLARWRHSCVRPCINHSISMKGTAVYNIAVFSVMYWLNVQAGHPAHVFKHPLPALGFVLFLLKLRSCSQTPTSLGSLLFCLTNLSHILSALPRQNPPTNRSASSRLFDVPATKSCSCSNIVPLKM